MPLLIIDTTAKMGTNTVNVFEGSIFSIVGFGVGNAIESFSYCRGIIGENGQY